MKKCISLLLTLAVCLSLAVPAMAAYPATWDEAKVKMELTSSMDGYDFSVDQTNTLYKEVYDTENDYKWDDWATKEEEYRTSTRYYVLSENDTITVKNLGTENDYYLSIYVTSFIKEGDGKYVSHIYSQQGYSLRANGIFEHNIVSAGDDMPDGWNLKKIYAGESVTISAADLLTTIYSDDYQADGEYIYEFELCQVYPAEDRYWYQRTMFLIDNSRAAQIKAAGKVEEDPGNPFTDVPVDAYYHDPVLWALENDITQGTSKTTFSPTATCTRGQVATFLWRAKGCPEPETTKNPFKDVKESDYYYKAILWAYENGITNGTSKTTFDPAGTCTSAHVVTFLWRANGKPAAEHNGSEYYAEAVAWADGNGLLAGTDVAFAPGNLSPRADIVTYLYRDAVK